VRIMTSLKIASRCSKLVVLQHCSEFHRKFCQTYPPTRSRSEQVEKCASKCVISRWASAKPQKDFCLFGPFGHFSACRQVSTSLLTLDLMIAKAYGSLCLSCGLPISLRHILSKTPGLIFFKATQCDADEG
jgi:hypothetical protein